MLPCARRHRAKLLFGGVMALAVVGIRLALPWLVRAMLKPLLKGVGKGAAGLGLGESGLVSQPLLFGVLFLVLLIALGFADFLMRLKFAEFSIGTVRDLRAKAFQSAMQIDPRIRPSGPGDLVARLVGDTARIKEGLKGFLVHVATNGLMLLGVSVVLLWVDLVLGLIFASAYALIACVVLHSTLRVYRRTIKQRAKEGELADTIHHAWRDDNGAVGFRDVNRSSGRHEATVTRLQGRTTWAAHAIFGAAILTLTWLGTSAVTAGELTGGDMLVYIWYALMTRAPVVQLARQGTRTGKILACAERLEEVLRNGRRQESAALLPELAREIRVERVRVDRPTSVGGGRRLLIGALALPAGSRVLVVGANASGKSTLLALLAGALTPKRGEVWWDDVPLAEVSRRSRHQRIVFHAQEPRWAQQPLWHVLGLSDADLGRAEHAMLKKCGAMGVISRLPGGLETEISSEFLSVSERHALVLGRLLLADASLVLLDEPFKGFSRRKARKRLRAVLARHTRATVVVATDRPSSRKLFDRVIELKHGRVVFDGPPKTYRARPAPGNGAASNGAASSVGQGVVASALNGHGWNGNGRNGEHP